MDSGRMKSMDPPCHPWIAQAWMDGGKAPGCERRRRLHSHHLGEWKENGCNAEWMKKSL